MTYTFPQSDIDAVVRANGGKGYVSTPLSSELKAALSNLVINAGFDRAQVAKLTGDNLVMVYSMARSESASTRRNAINVATRLIEQANADPLGLGGTSGGASGKELEALKQQHRDELNRVLADLDDMRRKYNTAHIDATDYANQVEGLQRQLDAQEREKLHKLTVTNDKGITTKIGVVHAQTPKVIEALDCGLNVYLWGPAGSGKTTMGKQAAEALGVPFYFTGKLSDEFGLIGFTLPNGETYRTPFREAYEKGGLFLFDEYDGSNPNAVVAMNAALANKVCAFPDGVVPMHADFKCIAAGNTAMTGGDGVYTGRQVQDGAAVDRFVFIKFDYDLALERAICPNADWVAYVQAVREAVKERALDHLVTPRASLDGAALLAKGWSWDDAANACIWKGLDADTVDAIKARVAIPRNAANIAA